MKRILTFILLTLFIMGFTSCASSQSQPTVDPVSTNISQPNMPNPASAFCVEQGFKSEIRTADDGSQTGYCICPDGSECDEWAYYRGECGSASSPTVIPTARPIDSADYQGWWTYTHAVYKFSIMLAEDWVVEEVITNDPLMNNALNLHPKEIAPDVKAGYENIRMTFRRVGEDVRLWPTGVGQGEFIQQGALDISGQPARRVLLVCPNGDVTSIWYQNAEEGQPNITRGDMEFGFIFSGAPSHCELGYNLGGKTQYMGEMIIASLKVP